MRLKSATGSPVKVRFQGVAYEFPSEGSLEVGDDEVGRWFLSATTKAKSPRDGRPHETCDLVETDEEPLGIIFEKEPPPPPPEPVLSHQPRKGDAPPPTATATEAAEKKAISAVPGEKLMEAAKKLGVWRRGMERHELVDLLHTKGWRPGR